MLLPGKRDAMRRSDFWLADIFYFMSVVDRFTCFRMDESLEGPGSTDASSLVICI